MAPAHESETIVFNFRKLLSTLPNYAELEQILLFSVNWGKQVCCSRTHNLMVIYPIQSYGEKFLGDIRQIGGFRGFVHHSRLQ